VTLENYAFGRVTLEGRTYAADLIVLPDRVISHWWREEGHSLSVSDLAAVFEAAPEILVVGTGAQGMMRVPQATRDALAAACIRLVVECTRDACETFNRLSPTARVAAALHLTC